MLTRRLFLAGALSAPAIVRSESLMKLWVPPERKVVMVADLEPSWWGVDWAKSEWDREHGVVVTRVGPERWLVAGTGLS